MDRRKGLWFVVIAIVGLGAAAAILEQLGWTSGDWISRTHAVLESLYQPGWVLLVILGWVGWLRNRETALLVLVLAVTARAAALHPLSRLVLLWGILVAVLLWVRGSSQVHRAWPAVLVGLGLLSNLPWLLTLGDGLGELGGNLRVLVLLANLIDLTFWAALGLTAWSAYNVGGRRPLAWIATFAAARSCVIVLTALPGAGVIPLPPALGLSSMLLTLASMLALGAALWRTSEA